MIRSERQTNRINYGELGYIFIFLTVLVKSVSKHLSDPVLRPISMQLVETDIS